MNPLSPSVPAGWTARPSGLLVRDTPNPDPDPDPDPDEAEAGAAGEVQLDLFGEQA